MILRGVGRRHASRGPWVLRGVDLELPAGALVRIEGPNGAGKSTLLRLLAGIDAPTEGRVTGRPRTAYVPERFPASLPFTAAGYLVHMGRAHGLTAAAAATRAAGWLERFGAGGYARTPVAELSKGTAQKVAVAQALMAAPGLLVLDEAWTGLDAGARAELDRAVAERLGDGATVVFVDHDPHRLADAAPTAHRLDGAGLVAVVATAEGPRVRIEATCQHPTSVPPELPDGTILERAGAGTPAAIRLTTTTAHSDPLLRALLAADPPWHITGLTRLPARVPASVPGARADSTTAHGPYGATNREPDGTDAAQDRAQGAGHGRDAGPAPADAPPLTPYGRTLGRTASLARYQTALLARSQRWLAPVLLYAAALGIGVRAGQPVLDSLGYASAVLLPVAAWIVRICATQEPPAARAVSAAAVGPQSAHLAALVAGLACALGLGCAGAAFVLLISDPAGTGGTVAVPLLPAALAGLGAITCCALLGAAVGALCTRPLVHRRGWSLAAAALGSLSVLVAGVSPANAAVSALVSGSATGTVPSTSLPAAAALAVAVGAAALTSRTSALRG
ncbi:ATP-binding cassette domain-containing protein [Streptomyces sp. NPDC051784]|uniref:ATP-binding cassette domain-containing protein n=1 Tax=Streptomyces sp. NPDC051784 TaxID=3155805 RepID=UPI00341898BF